MAKYNTLSHNVNVLITSFGSSNARAISRIFHERFPEYSLYGCDINKPNTLTSIPYVQTLFQVPKGNDPDYIPFLINRCVGLRIDLIIPIHDDEIQSLSKNVKKFSQKNIILFLPHPKVVDICRNKFLFYKTGLELDIPVIRSSKEPLEDYPQFMKPITGNGSVDCFKIFNKEEANIFQKRVGDVLFQEFFEGTQLNVDFVADKNYKVTCAQVREDILFKAGVAVKVKIIDDPIAMDLIKETVNKLKYSGIGGFELFKIGDEYKFIELNPRPNSGIIYTHLSGLDIFGHFLKCAGFQNVNIKDKEVTYDQLMSKELVAFTVP